MEIEVMYTDLSRTKVPLSKIKSLPADNVLFIVVRNPTAEDRRARNIVTLGEFDNYAICRDKEWILGFAYDDRDCTWWKEDKTRAPGELPLKSCTIFHGGKLPDEDFAKAQTIFEKEML